MGPRRNEAIPEEEESVMVLFEWITTHDDLILYIAMPEAFTNHIRRGGAHRLKLLVPSEALLGSRSE